MTGNVAGRATLPGMLDFGQTYSMRDRSTGETRGPVEGLEVMTAAMYFSSATSHLVEIINSAGQVVATTGKGQPSDG